jgi:hypothetical protein
MTPKYQWTTESGKVVKIFATDVPNKYRAKIDEKPWNPWEMVARVAEQRGR